MPARERVRAMMRRVKRFALVCVALGALSSLTACMQPVKVKPACQQQVDECLKGCPAGGPPTGTRDVLVADGRSDCERRCHQLCR